MIEHMEYIGRINKEGNMDDFPIEIRCKIYDFIMPLDLDEDDKLRSEGQYGMHQSDEMPGVNVVIYNAL